MTNAFCKAVAANTAAIRALLAASGPQTLCAIKRECAMQAFADKESITFALRDMVRTGEVTEEIGYPEMGDDYIVYELSEAGEAANDIAKEALVVEVEVRNVYGKEMIYPANFAAEKFALLAGKKTLSRADLIVIGHLGFVVEEVASKKLAA